MNGCHYVVHADGDLDIAGTECKGITYTGAGCTVVLPAQAGLEGLTYTNKGAGATREITVETNLVTCPKNGPFSNGVMSKGAFSLTGEGGGAAHAGLWWE